MKVFAFSNLKGGVGKSMLTVYFARYSSAAGYRVLVIDADAQHTTTDGLLPYGPGVQSLYEAIHNDRWIENIVAGYQNVDVIPANWDLEKLNLQTTPTILRDAIRKIEAGGGDTPASPGEEPSPRHHSSYDIVLIDTPGTINLFTLAAVVASDRTVVPVRPDRDTLEATKQFIELVTQRLTLLPGIEERIYGAWNQFRGRVTESDHNTLAPQVEVAFEIFENRFYHAIIRDIKAISDRKQDFRPISTAKAFQNIYNPMADLFDEMLEAEHSVARF